MSRRALTAILGVSMMVLLASCASDAVEQAQVASVAPTSVPTTAPLLVPTATAVPAPTSTPLPAPSATPTVAPTVEPTPTLDPAPTATPASEAAPATTDTPPATATVEVIETPTSVPTPTAAEPATQEDTSDPDPDAAPEPTAAPETPTAVVVASGEPPLECFDRVVQVYRGYVEATDALSFEGGKVYCGGAGTTAVSAARSYRHSSGLIIQRNADYIFNEGGTAYIPFSGFVHFCLNGQPASAPIRADKVPALLVVIDNEAQRQIAQGASAPTSFTVNGAQC